ncbi:RNA polymerase sigma-70 factor, ECF subfamily [Hathewaya proteolytica DSM 3090]|uniref:RNA polymerase sigma-70 factor, ECF subfamily n=1 Tax=Hathewaya proteolytica DSM 3090 TaxID=1121331 RepID=A0A1M6LZX0_9CLOT|nr:RNA polymerase sigma factor [Hathewaya proteolytica]SHJ76762.1 RNA polymerase sigma-70 factor, ECF subfamily [Hathewaya proteolytica DSM 3090]
MLDFDKIYEEYFLNIYNFIFSLCRDSSISEDITQETFFKVMKNIDTFKGQCKLSVWLCQIAKNTYFSYYNREKLYTDSESLNYADDNNSIEDAFIRRQSAFEIQKMLHEIEEPYKEVFSLRIFGELSFSEIAIIFNKTESWARVTFYRAKLKIKEKLK